MTALGRTGAFDAPMLARQIEAEGYGVVPGFLAGRELAEAQGFVTEAVACSGGEYVGFDGATQLSGTVYEALARDEALLELLHALYASQVPGEPPDQDLYYILRCLSGASGQANSMRFHYDSYVVTALIPVLLPTPRVGSPAGDLLLSPRRRPVRRSYVRNVIDKAVIESAPSRRRLLRTYEAGGMLSAKLTPGDLVLFWGYRTPHTNEACDPAAVRATAIYHFGEPHADGRLRRALKRGPRN